MWGLGVEEDKAPLKAGDLAEFRRRLKSSFGSAEFLEEGETCSVAEGATCLICTTLLDGYGKIVRRCRVEAHPCEGSTCVCQPQICNACYTETLWKSLRSQKGLGRYRAACPACRAEFCHFDLIKVVLPPKPQNVAVQPRPFRYSLPRRVADEAAEREQVALYVGRTLEQLEKDESLAARVRRFALRDENRAPVVLEGLTSNERKEVHALAESFGLGHESSGEGEAP